METEIVIACARSWIGTPYRHQASVKGAGCDCLGLLRGVWRDLRGPEPEPVPPYAPDWAEAAREEALYMAFARHFTEIARHAIAPGDVALFRMVPRGPAKHCGIIALKQRSGSAYEESPMLKQRSGSAYEESPVLKQRSGSAYEESPVLKQRSGSAYRDSLTLIHARQNSCVSEEAFTRFWQRKLAFAFRI